MAEKMHLIPASSVCSLPWLCINCKVSRPVLQWCVCVVLRGSRSWVHLLGGPWPWKLCVACFDFSPCTVGPWLTHASQEPEETWLSSGHWETSGDSERTVICQNSATISASGLVLLPGKWHFKCPQNLSKAHTMNVYNRRFGLSSQ